MLCRKILLQTVLVFSAMGALTPVQADAGIIADCISRLLGLGDSRSLSPKIIVDPNYDKFKKELSENPNAIPPIRPYQESLISNWELLTDFRFWWVPGNIWYRLMEETPNYDQLGAERRNSLDTQGIKLPDPEVINPKGQWVDAATAEQAVALREFYRIGGFSSSAGMPDHSMHTDFDTGPEIDGTPASPDHGIYTQDDMGGPDSGGGFGND